MEEKYSYDSCYAEAKKYVFYSDFRKKSQRYYRASIKNGWIENFTWLVRQRVKNEYWTEERCMEESKKYSTRSEYSKCSGSSYNVALRNGWLDDYIWLEPNDDKEKHYWTESRCKEVALLCDSVKQFYTEYATAYYKSKKYGWSDNWTWLKRSSKPRGYWNFEHCKDVSQLFSSRGEFEKGASAAYSVSLQNGWLDEFTWLKDQRLDLVEGKIDSVYAYEFVELNAVYIGRTLMKKQKRRDYEHIFGDSKDAVCKFSKENNVTIPEMKILEENLTIEEGSKKEGVWLEKYKNEGWKILNRTKTGGIGGIGKNRTKYTYDVCYELAKQCRNISELRKLTSHGCSIAIKNGWIKDYVWFEHKNHPKDYWTEQRCYDEALQYSSRVEFARGSSAAYAKSVKERWINNYNWFKSTKQARSESRRIWTPEACREAALEFEFLRDFEQNKKGAYLAAIRNGWLKEYMWLKRYEKGMNSSWTEEKCRTESLKYDTLSSFREKCPYGYEASLKYGYLDNFTWLKRKRHKNGYWTEEKIIQESMSYSTLADFVKLSNAAYCAAKRLGILNKLTWLKRTRNK